MKYSTNKSYRDNLMIEVEKVVKSLDEKKPTKKSWWAFFKEFIKKLL